MIAQLSQPACEIARTTHSIIIKCVWDKESVVVKRVLPTRRSKDRWQNEVDVPTHLGPHVKSPSVVIVRNDSADRHLASNCRAPVIARTLIVHDTAIRNWLQSEQLRRQSLDVDCPAATVLPNLPTDSRCSRLHPRPTNDTRRCNAREYHVVA